MRDGCVSCGNTEGYSTSLPMSETAVCVVVGGWPMTYTTSTGGAGTLATGESTILVCDAYVEDVTHLGTKGKKDETSSG